MSLRGLDTCVTASSGPSGVDVEMNSRRKDPARPPVHSRFRRERVSDSSVRVGDRISSSDLCRVQLAAYGNQPEAVKQL